MACHDLELRSNLKITVHIYRKILTAMFDLDGLSHYRILTLTKGQIAKVKVTVNTIFFPDHCLLRVTGIGMILHAILIV